MTKFQRPDLLTKFNKKWRNLEILKGLKFYKRPVTKKTLIACGKSENISTKCELPTPPPLLHGSSGLVYTDKEKLENAPKRNKYITYT